MILLILVCVSFENEKMNNNELVRKPIQVAIAAPLMPKYGTNNRFRTTFIKIPTPSKITFRFCL